MKKSVRKELTKCERTTTYVTSFSSLIHIRRIFRVVDKTN